MVTHHQCGHFGVAAGKLYLAYRSEAALTRYLERPLARFTAQTIVDPDQMRQVLEAVRQREYCWAADTFEIGLTAISAPIFGVERHPIACIYICGPTFRFPKASQKVQIVRLITETCQVITDKLKERKR